MAISLLEARNQAGLKQKFVAEKLKVSPRTVQNWEKGQTIPKYAFVVLYAQLCGVEPQEIFLPKGLH